MSIKSFINGGKMSVCIRHLNTNAVIQVTVRDLAITFSVCVTAFLLVSAEENLIGKEVETVVIIVIMNHYIMYTHSNLKTGMYFDAMIDISRTFAGISDLKCCLWKF